MSQTLSQRIDDRIALWQLIQETGGELNPTLEAWMSEIDQSIATKSDRYKFALDEFSQEADRLRRQADDFLSAARSVEGVIDRIKDRIKFAMGVLGTDEIQGTLYRFKLANSAPKLVVNEAELDPTFTDVVQTTVPAKDRIKVALVAGIPVKGAHLEPVKALRTYVQKGTS